MDVKKLLLAGSLALASFATFADQPNYTYVGFGYVKMDLDDIDLDPTGFYIDGSLELGDNWFVRAGFQTVDDSNGLLDVDVDGHNLGAGVRIAASENTSLHVVADYLHAEAEASHRYYSDSVSEDENGFSLGVGVRSLITDSFELSADAAYVDLGDDSVDFGVGAIWYVMENLGLEARLSTDDDSNRAYSLGLRIEF